MDSIYPSTDVQRIILPSCVQDRMDLLKSCGSADQKVRKNWQPIGDSAVVKGVISQISQFLKFPTRLSNAALFLLLVGKLVIAGQIKPLVVDLLQVKWRKPSKLYIYCIYLKTGLKTLQKVSLSWHKLCISKSEIQ